jgi:hypothetical protein
MRVTDKQLQAMVDRLNRLTGNPAEPWTRGEDGRNRANLGNYHLSFAYGGVDAHQMTNEGGGVRSLTGRHGTRRELETFFCGMMQGIETQQKNA